VGGTSGNLAGSGLGEVPVTSWLEAAWIREVGALSAPAGFGTHFGLGGSKVLAWISWLEGSGACPPSGTPH
jgi:hypothetical protein